MWFLAHGTRDLFVPTLPYHGPLGIGDLWAISKRPRNTMKHTKIELLGSLLGQNRAKAALEGPGFMIFA